MKCPYCGNLSSRVLDSRVIEEGVVIRRRRECTRCTNRFTTMEKAEEEPIVVIKQDGRREMFDKNKILTGLILAGQKRNIPRSTWQDLVDSLEQELRSSYIQEISTGQIGDYILAKLRLIDEVAYVRFASVFRQFPDIKTFQKELNKMIGHNQTEPER
ncbi:MAG TPA: transcriptional repressor NrdR [Firmicutes bacterium]|nr:transcriptional repressor NrdR [Bacillota bacterium]